jgi:hypothetical protein
MNGRLLLAPLLLAPVVAVGSLAFSQAAYARREPPPRIVCDDLSGNYETGSTITISGCTKGPDGATTATTPMTECQKNCVIVETWSNSVTTTEKYNAPDKVGKAAKKECKSHSAIAVASETGKVTAGYGVKGKVKATVCAFSDGSLSLAPGTKLDL